MKSIYSLSAFLAFALFATTCLAKDPPSGFISIDKLTDAQAKAKKEKKLIAVVAKGDDDKCPICAGAMSRGVAAFRNDCVLVFVRVTDLRKKSIPLPSSVESASSSAIGGAAVNFYIFDPELKELVASINHRDMGNDPKPLREVKKKVDDAQKKLASAPSDTGK